jgi:hypothetical protein
LLTLFDVYVIGYRTQLCAGAGAILPLFVGLCTRAGRALPSGDKFRSTAGEKYSRNKAKIIEQTIIDVIVLAFSGIVTYYAVLLTIRSVTKLTPVMKIPYCYIDAAIVFGAGTMVFFAVQRIIQNIKKLKQDKKGE